MLTVELKSLSESIDIETSFAEIFELESRFRVLELLTVKSEFAIFLATKPWPSDLIACLNTLSVFILRFKESFATKFEFTKSTIPFCVTELEIVAYSWWIPASL